VKNSWWGDPIYRNFKSTGPRWSDIADFQSIFARSASAVKSSKKGQLKLIAFHYALSNELEMNIVCCPWALQRWLKNAKRPFMSKIAIRLKKVYYKVSLCENCQQQRCKAFIDLTIRARMIGGRHPLLRENLAYADSPA